MGIFLSGPAFVIYLLIAGFLWHKSEIADAIEASNLKATAERQAAVAEFVVGITDRETKRQAEAAAERGRIALATATLNKGVPSYVTQFADSRCVVPVGFVQHYNAAWGLSQLPAAMVGLVDKPSGIPLSGVESVNTDNAGSCRLWKDEALRGRAWYTENKAKFDAFSRSTDARGNGGQSGKLPQPQKGE